MSWLAEFHFLRPYWLFALILPLLLSWHIFKNEALQSSWAKVCDEHLLNFLLIKGENKQRRIPYILGILFLILMILAVAGPSWQKRENPALSIDNPVMMVLNLSEDMQQTDVMPNRLERAKFVIQDVSQTFETTETGLMIYVDEPFVLTPLTEDTSLIENLLPVIDANIVLSDGDRLDRAIDMAVARMQDAGYTKGNMIVLAPDVREYFDAALRSAEKAFAQGFEVNVINVSAQDNDKLKMVAEKGNGLYLNYNQSYTGLSNKINDIYQKELKESENMQSEWEDAGYYLLWLPGLLLLYYFRKGVVFALILWALSSPVYAGWFLNNNQEGMRYFKHKQYEEAAQKFEDAQWRGAAAYKNGDFEQAYQDFSGKSDATALYNQGNALAKSGKIDKAIGKYEQVLELQPDFEDAAYNLEYLKQLQQQQQSQDNKKNDQSEEREDNTQPEDGQQKQDENQNADGAGEQGDDEQNQSEEEPENNSQNQNEQRGQEDASQEEQSEQGGQQNQNDDENKSEQDSSEEGDESKLQNQQQGNQQNEQSGEDGENKQSESEEDSNAEQNDAGDEQQENNQQQNQGDDDQNNEAEEDNEQQQQIQAQGGEKDEQNGAEAESQSVEFGEQDDENMQMQVRMQKFRDVPEDVGGLLRAIIAREYSKNRYLDN